MKNSIKRSLSFRLAAIILLSGMTIGAIYYSISIYYAEMDFNKDVKREANQYAHILAVHLWNFDENAVGLIGNALLVSGEIIGIRVFDEKKRIFFEKGLFAGSELQRVSKEIRYADKSIGQLELAFSKAHLSGHKRNVIITSLLVVFAVGFSLFFLLQIQLKHAIINPIEKLIKDVEKIGMGNLAYKVKVESNNEFGELANAFNQMTENLEKEIRERLQATLSLKEKEVLLREIHHRVKNNMQVIVSLLRLQSERIKEKRYADIFKESENRIKSMSLIHEKLYQSKDFANLDFNAYAKTLMNSVFRSHGVDTSKIALKIEVGDVILDLDNAIHCGLIINELVSNSLKYAFPQDRKGEIRVAMRPINSNGVELTVSDDGIGIPEDIDFRNTDSLGLDLVITLAEDQLEGKIDLDRRRGTAFKIQFRKQIQKTNTDKEG